MVKDIKSKIQDTDRFIIQDVNDDLKTVDGSDLAEFVEDLQARFTDDVERLVVELNTSVQNNAATIGVNQANNEVAHSELQEDINSNKTRIAENRTKNNVQDTRLDRLEKNSRIFGFYTLGEQDIADNGYTPFLADGAVSTDPDVASDEGVTGAATTVKCPPGFVILLNNSGKVATKFKNVTKIAINKSDGFGNKAGFLGVYGSDVIEITAYVNNDPGKEDGIDVSVEDRATFRVLYEQEIDIALQSQSGDIIVIDVELSSTTFPNGSYRQGSSPPTNASDYYNKITNYPSQATDNLVTKDNLPKALSPIGGIKIWPKSTDIPKGYMICDGSSISSIESRFPTEDLTELKAIISGDIPDLRGRTPIGTLHNWKGDINVNANKSRYGITEFKWIDQQTVLKGEWFGTNSAGEHNHTVNISSGGSHSHKVGNTNSGAKGTQTKAHSVYLNNDNYTNTSTAPNHSHNASVTYSGEHHHNITIKSDELIGNEIRPAGYGVVFIMKIFHVDPFA